MTTKHKITYDEEQLQKLIQEFPSHKDYIKLEIKKALKLYNKNLKKFEWEAGASGDPNTLCYNLQKIGKSINLINKKTMIVNSYNSNDSYDSNNTNKTNKTINYQEILICLGSGIREKILTTLYCNSPLSYSEIAKEIGEKGKKGYDVVVNTVKRDLDLFQEKERKGKTILFELSPLGTNLVENEIRIYQEKQGSILKLREAERNKEKELLKIKEEVREALNLMKSDFKEFKDILFFDFFQLSEINPFLSDKLLEEPEVILESFKEVFKEIDISKRKLNFAPINLPKSQEFLIEDLKSGMLNKLVSISCRVVSRSEVRPIIKSITYECSSCGTVISKLQFSEIKDIEKCACGYKGGLNPISDIKSDVSKIIIEDLRGMNKNINPSRLNGFIEGGLTHDKIIESFKPNNEIKVIGILEPIYRKAKGFGIPRISTILDYSFKILYGEPIEPEEDLSLITEKEIKEIKSLSSKINKKGFSEINTSFAPHIYGHEPKKNALILQCCLQENRNKDTRTQMNTLFIGDPGIAKTQLMNFAFDIIPGSTKSVGSGSSAVGLTASALKDDTEFGGWRLEAGAFPRAKTIFCLDELNNLPYEERTKLQYAMEEQEIIISKANIQTSIGVTAGMIATANPKQGTFDINYSLVAQFDIPPQILNRFDLIFTFKDVVNEETDRKIAKTMIRRKRGLIKSKYDKDFLRKFFLYIRNQEEPIISEDMENLLEDYYYKARTRNRNGILLNPRFNNAILRLVIASAKLRLSKQVEEKDIERCWEILSASHYQLNENDLEITHEKPK